MRNLDLNLKRLLFLTVVSYMAGIIIIDKERQYIQESGKIVITWTRLATTHALKPLTTVNT